MTTTLTNGDKAITVWCKCFIAVSSIPGCSVVVQVERTLG